jgi:hypothetical protein
MKTDESAAVKHSQNNSRLNPDLNTEKILQLGYKVYFGLKALLQQSLCYWSECIESDLKLERIILP